MEKVKNVLLVEDDPNLGFVVKDNLLQRGYHVTHAHDGEEGWQTYQNQSFDLCLLDVMMPRLDGFNLARRMREQNQDIPILFLTAKSMLEDRLEAFELGGDDFLTKPFSIDELVMRMEVFLRRSKPRDDTTESLYQLGEMTFDVADLKLKGKEGVQKLTQREADLLLFFCANKNQVVKREVILKAIWGDDDYFFGRSLDVFISKLRKYLRQEPTVQITNYHGVGFKFEVTQ
ncbi:MAG: response regulator transcription factor [Bacteroidota bacterium]